MYGQLKVHLELLMGINNYLVANQKQSVNWRAIAKYLHIKETGRYRFHKDYLVKEKFLFKDHFTISMSNKGLFLLAKAEQLINHFQPYDFPLEATCAYWNVMQHALDHRIIIFDLQSSLIELFDSLNDTQRKILFTIPNISLEKDSGVRLSDLYPNFPVKRTLRYNLRKLEEKECIMIYDYHKDKELRATLLGLWVNQLGTFFYK